MVKDKDDIDRRLGNSNQLADMQKLKKDIRELEDKTQRSAWFCKYTISREDLPPPFDQQNTPIKRVVTIYFPEYDEQKQEIICFDENRKPTDISHKSGYHHQNEVFIFDRIFMLPQEFLNAIHQKEKTIKSTKIILFLNKIISEHLNKEEKLCMLCHEMKHARNYLYLKSSTQESGYSELSPKQKHYYDDANEKSAYLQEIFTLCATYFQKGENLKVFPDRYFWLKTKIKDLTSEQRKQALTDIAFIVNETMDFWDKKIAPFYTQKIYDKSKPEKSEEQSEDNAREAFLSCLENMFTFAIYNPNKQAYETTNVLPLIENRSKLQKENVTITQGLTRFCNNENKR